jgi:predicted PhzF superfamily epimerase YddE/YHI9
MPPEPVEVTHTSVFANGSRGGNPCPVILDAADLGPEQM